LGGNGGLQDSQTRDNYAELLCVALVALGKGDVIPGGVHFSPPFTMQAVGVNVDN